MISLKNFRPGIVEKIAGFWLVTNYNCNNRCWWCYAQTKEFKPLPMPLEYAKDVLNLMHEFDVKSGIIIGGEPAVYPYLREILLQFKKFGMGPSIVSNGRMFSKESFLEGLLDASTFATSISMQTHEKDLHDQMTGTKGSFNQTVGGVKNCVRKGIPLTVQTTLTKQNVGGVLDLIRFVESLGVKNFVVGFGLPPFEQAPNLDGFLDIREIPGIIRDIYMSTKDLAINVVFNQTIPLCMYGDILPEMLEKVAIRAGCHVNFGNMVVWEPDGTISPCAHFSGKTIVAGLLDDNRRLKTHTKADFLRKWNSEELIEFRKNRFSYVSPRCESCEYWGLCTGGCPISWFYYNPQDVIPI